MIFAVVYTKDAADDIDAAFSWLAARAPAAALEVQRHLPFVASTAHAASAQQR